MFVRDLCPEAINASGIVQYCGPIRSNWTYERLNDGRWLLRDHINPVVHIEAEDEAGLATEMRRRIAAYAAQKAEEARLETERYASLAPSDPERQAKWLDGLLEREDDELTKWAIRWLSLDIAELWPELDGDSRQSLVAAGVVHEVTCTATCTDVESWQSDWRDEDNAAWPEFTIGVTAEGLEDFEVKGWHLVGPAGPDGNRQSEEWDTQTGDGQFHGVPRVDEDERTFCGGDNIDDNSRPIPCWRLGDNWVTIEPRDLEKELESAAASADHGVDPSWEEVSCGDMKIEETLYVIRDAAIVEVGLMRGGIAGHTVEVPGEYRDHQVTEYWAEAWGLEKSDNVYETRSKAVAELKEKADDDKVYDTQEAAEAALARRVVRDHDDLPEGLTLEETAGVLHVVSEDGTDPYPLTAADLTSVAHHGWDALLFREGLADVFGVLHEVDSVIFSVSPERWVEVGRYLEAPGRVSWETTRGLTDDVRSLMKNVLENRQCRLAPMVLADALDEIGGDYSNYAATIRESVEIATLEHS